MLSKALILLTLLSQFPHYLDKETWKEREARLEESAAAPIMDAVDRATCKGASSGEDCKRIWPLGRKELAMLLITQAVSESHLAVRVHDNQCRLEKGECDSLREIVDGKVSYAQRSFSFWQLKQFSDIPDEDWTLIQAGRPGTGVAAWHAARRLSSALQDCGDIEGAIARYAVGNGCKWEGSAKRVALYKELLNSPVERLEELKLRRQLYVNFHNPPKPETVDEKPQEPSASPK